MNAEYFAALLDALVHETIAPADFELLQSALKTNAELRAEFRRRMDLETSLRTWAEQTSDQHLSSAVSSSSGTQQPRHHRAVIATLSAVCLLLLAAVIWWFVPLPARNQIADDPAKKNPAPEQRLAEIIGEIRQQTECVWASKPQQADAGLSTGVFALTTGVAEFQFHSGTNVILEAPCELVVESSDSARLLAGNVVVKVTEFSDGFVLETPEAQIFDEGTEYAVALNQESVEVHVYDGSVIWIPNEKQEMQDRITTGQAKRFRRSRPEQSVGIPFGKRQFVRRLEETVRQQTGESLLAYDGFENLAGQLRRDRSGIGWTGGWQPAGRNRGKLADVIDAPDDTVFEWDRTSTRLLSLTQGADLRRILERPIEMKPGESLYLSLLVELQPVEDQQERSLQIILEPEIIGRGHRRRQMSTHSLGVSSEGFPFVKPGTRVSQTASPLRSDGVYLCVVKIEQTTAGGTISCRYFHPTESIPEVEPTIWTVQAEGESLPPLHSIRLTVGSNAHWQVDELKFGTSWHSVVGTYVTQNRN